ncbi:19945_t:CDS:2 [Funneliformis geosporum]|uniref:8305_t:CDS:1 n=1 Tax=Funneliformis geosporum TaxID=1117311 RepID=A0A9W4SFQ3_9GLOM|nr:19945_t:CDS:2 [Funneliformis geosporum]CAI2167869.1 8305_t:CDS:2 [Funneliformis geosporum]
MNESKLKLQISLGTSYDPKSHITILPNDDSNPYYINTQNFTARICVRIRDFKGITPLSTSRIESSPYFEGNNDQYSIQVQGRFKGNDLTADDIIFGVNKINLPPGSWFGLKILQYIDSGLEADITCDKPWAYSPLAFTMNRLNVHEEPDIKDGELPPWPSINGEHVEENVIFPRDGHKIEVLNNVFMRKKYFKSKENRKNFPIKESQVWNFDFFNAYVDFNDVAIKLPGFKLGVLQYWEGQPVRYVCKSRDSSIVFFVVIFQLIPIEEDDDNTITKCKGEKIRESFEEHPDISDFTPKTGARWASIKSPTSLFPFNKDTEFSIRPSPTSSLSSSPSPSSNVTKFNANFEKNDHDDDVLD